MSPPSAASPTPCRLAPYRLGIAVGTTGVVFYLGGIITMVTVPRDKAVSFFNSLLHGLDIDPILRDHMPPLDVLLGIVSTFILGWSVGYIVAGIYNCSLKANC